MLYSATTSLDSISMERLHELRWGERHPRNCNCADRRSLMAAQHQKVLKGMRRHA